MLFSIRNLFNSTTYIVKKTVISVFTKESGLEVSSDSPRATKLGTGDLGIRTRARLTVKPELLRAAGYFPAVIGSLPNT